MCNCTLSWLIVAGGWMGRWARDGDSGSDVTFLWESQGLVKKHLLYADRVHFIVDWLFWDLYGSYIDPRCLLSWKMPGNFSFDNIGPLNQDFLFWNLSIFPANISEELQANQKHLGKLISCKHFLLVAYLTLVITSSKSHLCQQKCVLLL